ncbi:MAG: hypothetical protein IT349_03395 [Candidatus Eisenbacteria bacterium]|nr:hypothetical protein [Candidatus Eisenbacteria bacterium]
MSVVKLRTEDPAIELQRLHARLKRLQDYASPKTFTNPTSALLACRNELKLVLPLLIQHFAQEEAVAHRLAQEGRAGHPAERGTAENQSRLRELRALLESADLVLEQTVMPQSGMPQSGMPQTGLEQTGAGADPSPIARGLCAYLAACIGEILRHEAAECPLQLGGRTGA